jgi:hypothetical protein
VSIGDGVLKNAQEQKSLSGVQSAESRIGLDQFEPVAFKT